MFGFSRGSKNVIAFFENFDAEINEVFNETETGLNQEVLIKYYVLIRSDLSAIFLQDRDCLLVQDVLDNQSQMSLANSLSMSLKLKYGPNSIYYISSIVRDRVFGASDETVGAFIEDKEQPRYTRLMQNIYPDKIQYWFDLTSEIRDEIIGLVNSGSSRSLLMRSKLDIEARRQKHLMNLINQISGPFYFGK